MLSIFVLRFLEALYKLPIPVDEGEDEPDPDSDEGFIKAPRWVSPSSVSNALRLSMSSQQAPVFLRNTRWPGSICYVAERGTKVNIFICRSVL